MSRSLKGDAHAPCVLTIGNFDGVHRGHQAMVAELHRIATTLSVPAQILTFEPHPMEFLAGANAPPRLQRFREKMAGLAHYDVKQVVCARFGERLSRYDPQAFIDRVLVGQLRVRHLLVGDDFRFGHQGAGTFATLSHAGERLGFGVSRVDTVQVRGARVSSTRVRQALASGEMDLVNELLGRRYSVCGRVQHGQQLGRTIGFPTANISSRRNRFAVSGVYAVRVSGAGLKAQPAVANVGRRPTVGGIEERLEVHVFDFDGDLYGHELVVEFETQMRDERRFPDIDTLKAQIARDAQAARAHFAGGSS